MISGLGFGGNQMTQMTEMQKFEQQLENEIKKYFPNQRFRGSSEEQERALARVMNALYKEPKWMLSPDEITLDKLEKEFSPLNLLWGLKYYSNFAGGACPPSFGSIRAAEYSNPLSAGREVPEGLSKKFEELGGEARWQALGGLVRLNYLKDQIEQYAQLCDWPEYERMVLRLDYLLLKLFDPENYDWVVDECYYKIDFPTKCYKFIAKFSHLFRP